MALYADHDWSDLEPPHRRIAAMVRALHLAGWSIGDVGGSGPDGVGSWLVYGHNGENVIRAEAESQSMAWRLATDQARSLGMLGR